MNAKRQDFNILEANVNWECCKNCNKAAVTLPLRTIWKRKGKSIPVLFCSARCIDQYSIKHPKWILVHSRMIGNVDYFGNVQLY